MYAFAYLGVGGDCLCKLLGKVLGVACHKTQTELAIYARNFFKQLRKTYVVHAVGIGVYILPEQSQLLISVRNERAGLRNNVFRTPASLPAADIRNYAIAAEVIASVSYVYPRIGIAGAQGMFALRHLTLAGLNLNDSLFATSLEENIFLEFV